MAKGDRASVAAMVAAAQNAGVSANEGLRRAKAAESGVRRQTWFRVWGEVSAGRASRPTEAAARLDAVPRRDELRQMTTRKATGVMQLVEVYLRDKQSGLVVTKNFSVTSRKGVTRSEAVSQAQSLYSQTDDRYPTVYLGALHVGSYLMVPEEG